MIAAGHPQAWDYTPVQAEEFSYLAERRERRQGARSLNRSAVAARSESKELNRAIRKDWDA